MSDLSQFQIEEFKIRLQQQQQQLRQQVQNKTLNTNNKNFADMAGTDVRDPGDESLAIQMSDFNISTLEKQIAELKEVEAALDRIERGIYGKCFECDCDIPYERLKAYPTATCCTECQARLENARKDLTPSL